VTVGEKRCMCIKDWFKPIFPLLTWLLHKIPNTRFQFQHLPPRVISQVTHMPISTK
jgi:hypothetical protein